MKNEAGVLAGEEEGRCGFLHLSFQEYLAAEYAAREGLTRELASRAANSCESSRRVAAVLRLMRDRAEQVPELAEIAQRLAKSEDAETQGFAREILARLKITLPQAADERKVIVDERSGVTFVEIPAGEFEMGAEISEYDDERPVQRVHVSRGFCRGKYPVTNAQFAQYMKVVGSKVKKPARWEERRCNQADQPVVGVSWDEAQAFCE